MKKDILEKLVKLSQNENIPEELVDVLAYLCEKKAKKDKLREFNENYLSVEPFIQSYHIKTSKTDIITKHDVYSLYESFCKKFNLKPLVNSVFWPYLEKKLESIEGHDVDLEGKLKRIYKVRERCVNLTLEGV